MHERLQDFARKSWGLTFAQPFSLAPPSKPNNERRYPHVWLLNGLETAWKQEPGGFRLDAPSPRPIGKTAAATTKQQLCRVHFESIIFHDQVGQQLFASKLYFLPGRSFIGHLELQQDMLANPHIGHILEAQVSQAQQHGLALRIQNFFLGHYINLGNEFHNQQRSG